jgi:hypothetical protein
MEGSGIGFVQINPDPGGPVPEHWFWVCVNKYDSQQTTLNGERLRQTDTKNEILVS